MSEDDSLAVVGTVAAIVIGLLAGVWWVWAPACGLLVLEILALIPATAAGCPCIAASRRRWTRSPRRCAEIERSQHSD